MRPVSRLVKRVRPCGQDVGESFAPRVGAGHQQMTRSTGDQHRILDGVAQCFQLDSTPLDSWRPCGSMRHCGCCPGRGPGRRGGTDESHLRENQPRYLRLRHATDLIGTSQVDAVSFLYQRSARPVCERAVGQVVPARIAGVRATTVKHRGDGGLDLYGEHAGFCR